MTDKEATKHIKAIGKLAIDAGYSSDIVNACALAIRALEQEFALDKIRAEIESKYGQCDICEYFEDFDYEENDISEYRPIGDITDILQIIDKYR